MSGPSDLQTATIRQLMDSQNAPNVKKYYVNDGDGDPTDVYYAEAQAQAGATCLRQRMEYTTISGVKTVLKEAWESATWSGSAWDLS